MYMHDPIYKSNKRVEDCSPGVAGVPKPGATDSAWPKPPKPCEGLA